MQTVWEARFLNSQFVLTMACCVAIMVVSVILFIKGHDTYDGLVRCVCVISFAVVSLFCISSLSSAREDWRYAQTHQLVVEGVIENFITGENGSDSFSVEGVYFWCTPVDNNLFAYTLTTRDEGSVIEGNGQYVRLTYCTQNDLNSILKIETYTKS